MKKNARKAKSSRAVPAGIAPVPAPGMDASPAVSLERDLHKQRQEQEIILDSVPAFIWYKDCENRIIRANKAAAASGGMTKDQMEGRSAYELYPEFAEGYHRDDLEVIRAGQPKMGIIEGLELASGEKRWVRTDKIPYRDADGRIIGVIVFSTDITDLKTIEAALRQSEERFRALAEHSSVGFWRITRDGHTLYLNPAMCRILEINGIEELRGHTFHEYFTPESLDVMKHEHVKRAVGLASTYEAEILGHQGGRRNVLISGSPLLGPDGAMESMIGTFTDITDRKKAEDALRREQQLVQILLDNVPDAIYFKDLESRFVRVNPAHARIMGFKNPEEAIGARDAEIFRPEAAAAFLADEQAVIATGRPLIGKIEHHGGPQESMRWFSTTKVPMRDPDGRIVGTAGITREITDLKRAEDEIRKLNEELERRVADRTAKLLTTNRRLKAEIAERRQAERQVRRYQERLKSLASELSLAEERERRRIAVDLHDQIGQTLALIQIKLQELRESAPPGTLAGALDECVDLIRQPIQDTRSLVFNLSPPVLYDLGFEAAAAWLVEQHDRRAGISMTFEDDEQSKPLEQAVSVLLFRAIRELLTNVVKHSRAGKARVWLRRCEGELRTGVEDDGRGFDASTIGSAADKTGGFGLFSIREQLDRLGGRFEIDSSSGGGCRIILTVPLKTPSV